MKETAVEWLEKIRQGQKGQPFDDYEWEIAFNHAKEVEKEQIKNAFNYGQFDLGMEADEYYNQILKSE
jgi:hypothetical protein